MAEPGVEDLLKIVLLGRDHWWVAHAVVHDLNIFMGRVPPCPWRRQELNPVGT